MMGRGIAFQICCEKSWSFYLFTVDGLFRTKYSRMNQVKFVQDSFKKNLKGYGLAKADHNPSIFLKAVFHKF